MAPRPYDITIFGATGFTGALVAIELARILAARPSPLFAGCATTFAIAGRDRARLEAVVARIRAEVPSYRGEVAVLIADVADHASLVAAARQSRVFLSCVGPYRFYGPPVLRAAVEGGAHFADITGEPEYMERMEVEMDAAAKGAGVLVVPCCGFDSIPADVGCTFAVDTMRGAGAVATAIESYFTITGGPKGFRGHYATWESAVNGFASTGDLRRVRAAFAAAHPGLAVPVYGARLPRRGNTFWSPQQGRWAMPFMGSDPSVVRRTQRTLVLEGPREGGKGSSSSGLPPLVPVQYGSFFTVKNSYFLGVTVFCGALISFFARWKWGRRLLLSFPGFFTYGMFSHEGPTAEQRAATSFSMTFYVKGYSQKLAAAVLANPQLPATKPSPSSSSTTTTKAPLLPRPDVEAVVRVAGPEPGYVSTPKILLSAAFTILNDQLPFRGGVLTPAAAFRDTRIIDRMRALGIDVSVTQAPRTVAPAAL
jgi:hypothetical protein